MEQERSHSGSFAQDFYRIGYYGDKLQIIT